MNTWRQNLLILEAIHTYLDLLPKLLNDQWPSYRQRLVYCASEVMQAENHQEVSLAVDVLIMELLDTPAAGLVREIVGRSLGQSKSVDEELLRYSARELEIPASAHDEQIQLTFLISAGTSLNIALQSLSNVEIHEESPQPEVPPAERRINAWIVRDEDAQEPLKRGEIYELDFKVGSPVEISIITGPDSEVPPSDIPDEGLRTKWVVICPAVYLHEMVNEIPVTIRRGENVAQVASFSLLIPKHGDSIVVRLGVELPLEGSAELNVIIYASPRYGSEIDGEIYRQFNVKLPVADSLLNAMSEASLVEDEAVHVPAPHLNLRTTHEWTTPPGKLSIAVTGPASAYVLGTAGPYPLDKPTQWYAVQALVTGPIDNVRSSAERFRGKWENYLNDIDPQDLINRLQNFHRQYDWTNINYYEDAAHSQSWSAASSSSELYDLAFDGYSLYEAFFPPGSELRTWLDACTPGQRLSFSWVPTSGGGWIAHIPWGLMYQFAPVPGTPIDAMGFLGLRYRISYTAHVVQAPSRALGAVDKTNTVTMLYWGQQPQDPTAVEAQWQKSQLTSWPTQVFVPSQLSTDTPKAQLLKMLGTPQPSPVGVIYFFCQCSVGSGNDPVLRFGDTPQVGDVIRRTELAQSALVDRPLIFANACTTAATDPYIANELERAFFNRQCRAYIGTETKVPIPLASRVAYIFLNFFYRKIDPDPMPAGEALAQTRLFLWGEYKNIGGLLYTYINQYELYMADDAEVLALRL